MAENLKRALYAAYFSGSDGNSLGLFYIGDEVICGVDVGTVSYNGSYRVNQNDQSLEAVVEFVVPVNGGLITGVTGGEEPVRVPVSFTLPHNFYDGRVVRIDTPVGPVNARFEKLRDLP